MKKFHFDANTAKKTQHKKNIVRSKPVAQQNAGMNFVTIIGSVEQLRNPEFWR